MGAFLISMVVPLISWSLVFGQTSKPTYPKLSASGFFSSIESMVGVVFIGIIVVATGLFMWQGVIWLLKTLNLYKDPVLTAIQDGIEKLQKENKSKSHLENLTGVVAGLKASVDDLLHAMSTLTTKPGEILGRLEKLEKNLPDDVSPLLKHDDYGIQSIKRAVLDLKDSCGKITQIQGGHAQTAQQAILALQQSMNTVTDYISEVRGHIQNEVFKERQSKAFRTIDQINEILHQISKAVQAEPYLPMGKTVPDTYCQAQPLATKVGEDINHAVQRIKSHRENFDQETMKTLQYAVVLLDQLVKKVDDLNERVHELTYEQEASHE
jgi:regulator of sigma D